MSLLFSRITCLIALLLLGFVVLRGLFKEFGFSLCVWWVLCLRLCLRIVGFGFGGLLWVFGWYYGVLRFVVFMVR